MVIMSTTYTFKNSKNHWFFAVIFLITLTFSGVSQVTYTFTPCGALGAEGPTQTQVNTTYTTGNNLNGSVPSRIISVEQLKAKRID